MQASRDDEMTVAAPQHWKPAWRMSRGAARARAPCPVHHIRTRRESSLLRRVRLRGRGPRGAGIRGRAAPARIRPGRRQQRGVPRLRVPRNHSAHHHRRDGAARRSEPRGACRGWRRLGRAGPSRGAALLDRGRVPVGHSGHGGRHADPERGRVRPGDRRDAGKRRLPRPHHARAPHFLRAGLRFRLSRQPVQARGPRALCRARGHAAPHSRPAAAHPLPGAGARRGGARRARRRGGGGRGPPGARGRARAAAPQVHGARPGGPEQPIGRLIFHQPGAVGRRLR